VNLKLRKLIKEAEEAAAPTEDNRVQQLTTALEKQKINNRIFELASKLTSRQKIRILLWLCSKMSIPADVLSLAVSQLKRTQ